MKNSFPIVLLMIILSIITQSSFGQGCVAIRQMSTCPGGKKLTIYFKKWFPHLLII